MSRSLRISPQVDLPIELATRRSAIFGVSGSGKSNTATRCIELLLKAGEQVVLIDPKGEGWGLQTSADGRKAAFDIIVFGEPHGDIPSLREEHAEQVADFVVDSGRSVVLSLLGFDSDQSERRFVTRFFKRFYRRKSQLKVKTRTLVVLEEAHLFVPENASGANGDMVGAIKRIARQGRSAGIGLMVIDQRPQEVAKSIISQTELLICHQLIHKLDRDALRDWVRAYDQDGQGEQFLDSLADLSPGVGWVWSPAWLHLFLKTKIDRRETYDSGATPDGGNVAAPSAKAKVDLDALRSHLEKVVQEAKENDPKALRGELDKLRTQLAAKSPSPAVIPVLTDAQLARAEAAVAAGDEIVERLCAAVRTVIKDLDGFAGPVVQGLMEAFKPIHQARQPVPSRPTARAVPAVVPPASRQPSDSSASLGKCERAILAVLSQFPEGCQSNKLTLLSGYRWTGSFRNYLGALRTAGLIEGDNAAVMRITPEGLSQGPFPKLPSGQALVDYWLNNPHFGICERKILQAVIENPRGLTSDELCEATGYGWTGSFRNNLGALRTAGVLRGRNNERMMASEELLEASDS